jgi:hypothetical protein
VKSALAGRQACPCPISNLFSAASVNVPSVHLQSTLQTENHQCDEKLCSGTSRITTQASLSIYRKMSDPETVLSSSKAPTTSAEDRVTLTPPNTSSLPTPTFTPEPSCTRDIYFAIYTVDDIQCMIGDEVVACRYHHLGPTTSASECLPSDWATSDGVYTTMAPCPDGYTFACAASSEGEDKTTATCCPR